MEKIQENTHADVLGCEVKANKFYDLTRFYSLADVEDHTQGGVSAEKSFDSIKEDPVSLKILPAHSKIQAFLQSVSEII